MTIESRIPALHGLSFDHALRWFSELQCKGLLFHPDDDPNDIVSILDGEKSFSDVEVAEARFVIGELFTELGDDVYEAAYPIFMNVMGFKLDA